MNKCLEEEKDYINEQVAQMIVAPLAAESTLEEKLTKNISTLREIMKMKIEG